MAKKQLPDQVNNTRTHLATEPRVAEEVRKGERVGEVGQKC